MSAPGAPLERGYRLGRYEVVGRLSVGGMAELYLAFLAGQGGFRKFVALKRVLPAVAQQENFVKMFLDEARITASLSHPNIAQVYELAEDPRNNREPVLALEYVAGQNLAQIMRRARDRNVELPLGFSCRIIHDVLRALHSAHQFVEPATGTPMPVIHRDINPRNIMVTWAGGTKVIDFGIAKARGRLDQTQVGAVKGTVRYMSPEQILSKGLDGRSDLFATSAVFYELLSGLTLFDGPSDVAVITRVVECKVPVLLEVMPTLAPALADVLTRGLARLPDERWQSGREFARALEQAVPDLFDDVALAELMGRLFEDRIALSRALLQSSSTEASYANLEAMRHSFEEPGSKPNAASQAEAPPRTKPPSRPVLAEASTPVTPDRPPVAAEVATVQGPRRSSGENRPSASTAATLVMDAPPVAGETVTDLEPAAAAPSRKPPSRPSNPPVPLGSGPTRRLSVETPVQTAQPASDALKPRPTSERQLLEPVEEGLSARTVVVLVVISVLGLALAGYTLWR
jgi:serine/threonine-protein kinase